MLASVILRSLFGAGPFWGDTLTTLAALLMLFVLFPVSILKGENISMGALHERLPSALSERLNTLWDLLFLVSGLVLFATGIQLSREIPGYYSELGELSKAYIVLIVPFSGLAMSVAAAIRLYPRWADK
jgi:TRAP-type C4-dicarboxylate transport system permease small subunit